jgi:hypothetical protein
MLRLQDQRLEHRNGVERRPTTPDAITITETFDQPTPEILEVHGVIENLQWITVLAQRFKMIRKTEKIVRIHNATSMKEVNHIRAKTARLMRVSSWGED